MKFKYMLRGFGIGVLFSAIILALSYYNKPKGDLTDDQVMLKAKELGMMTEQDWKEKNIENTLDQMREGKTTDAAITADDEEDTEDTEYGTEGDTNPSDSSEDTEESTEPSASTEPTDSPTPTPSPTPKPTSKPTPTPTEEPKETVDLVVIKVVPGMVSSQVAEDLEDKGVVDDAYDFDEYMCENGFAPLIQAGTFYIPKDASYLEIAQILMRQ